MNLAYRWLCRSAYWRNTVETYILPWVLDGLDIGTNGDRDSGLIVTQAKPSSRTDSYVARTFDQQTPETDSATNYSPRTIVRVNWPVNSNVTAVISVSKSSYFQPLKLPQNKTSLSNSWRDWTENDFKTEPF